LRRRTPDRYVPDLPFPDEAAMSEPKVKRGWGSGSLEEETQSLDTRASTPQDENSRPTLRELRGKAPALPTRFPQAMEKPALPTQFPAALQEPERKPALPTQFPAALQEPERKPPPPPLFPDGRPNESFGALRAATRSQEDSDSVMSASRVSLGMSDAGGPRSHSSLSPGRRRERRVADRPGRERKVADRPGGGGTVVVAPLRSPGGTQRPAARARERSPPMRRVPSSPHLR